MADYATVEQIKGLGIQTDAPATALTAWEDLATGASRLFDTLCEVSEDFFAEENGLTEDRDFVGDGTAYLKLPPYVDLDSITINDGTIAVPDYTTDNVPDYIAKDGMLIVLEKTKQGSLDSAMYRNRFTGWPDGSQIRVSAVWGFESTPKDVQVAVAKIALHHWRMSDPVNADNTNATPEPLIDGLPASVWPTVEKYREKYSQRCLFA
jgi:hypothetical protein